jgi:hypothetical protein
VFVRLYMNGNIAACNIGWNMCKYLCMYAVCTVITYLCLFVMYVLRTRYVYDVRMWVA